MKALVASFNQEKALVGAFSVITNLRMEHCQALLLVAARHRVTVSAASWQLGYVRGLVTAASLLHAAELAALLLLSLADTRRRALAQLHKAAFGVFLVTSTGYFLVQIYLYRWDTGALGRLYWPYQPYHQS